MVTAGNVTADEKGLRWRSGSRQQYIPWEDVTGYYDQRKPGSDPMCKFAVAEWQRVVKTRAGTLTFNEGEWRNERQLRSWIRQYATSARDQSWGEMRRQPADWPSVFFYSTVVTRNALRWLHHWHRVGLVAVAAYFGWMWVTTHTLPNWGWLLTPSGLFFVGKQALLLAARSIHRWEEPYLNRKVRADMDGLTFIDGDERERIAWGEITDFYRQGRRSVVVTACGEWDFPVPLDPNETLRRIIRRYAVNAEADQWRKGAESRKLPSAAWYSE